MMEKLVMIRHGESEWNKQNLFTGWSDVDLSETGRKEAREAGRLLRENRACICVNIPVPSAW